MQSVSVEIPAWILEPKSLGIMGSTSLEITGKNRAVELPMAARRRTTIVLECIVKICMKAK